MEETTTITKRDLDTLVFCAFRYALGRRTYIVHDVVRIIIEYRGCLRRNTPERLAVEIKEARERGGLGDACDQKAWEAVLETIEREAKA